MSFFGKNKGTKNYRQTAIDTTDSDYGWYLCSHCGKKYRKSDMDADHIIPQSKGGLNVSGNLQMLCKHCNRSKGNSTKGTVRDLATRQIDLIQYSAYKNNHQKVLEGCEIIAKNLKNYSDNDLKRMYNDSTFSSIRSKIKNEMNRRGI